MRACDLHSVLTSKFVRLLLRSLHLLVTKVFIEFRNSLKKLRLGWVALSGLCNNITFLPCLWMDCNRAVCVVCSPVVRDWVCVVSNKYKVVFKIVVFLYGRDG